MSRSYRRRPHIGYFLCDHSDKWWKRLWHGRMRAMSRIALHSFDGDSDFLPDHREVDTIWASFKEGKMRFDPREHPELMRK
jgi:hypothetical protein